MDNLDTSNLNKKLASIISLNNEFAIAILSHCDEIQEKYKAYGVVSVGLFYGYDNGYNVRVAIKSGDSGPEWHAKSQLDAFNRFLAEDVENLEAVIRFYSGINLEKATFNNFY